MTDIFVTHGHGDHWFAAGLLAERLGPCCRHGGNDRADAKSVATRPFLWIKSTSASRHRLSR